MQVQGRRREKRRLEVADSCIARGREEASHEAEARSGDARCGQERVIAEVPDRRAEAEVEDQESQVREQEDGVGLGIGRATYTSVREPPVVEDTVLASLQWTRILKMYQTC